MISYREHLEKIGIGRDEAVSYRAFYSYPMSLRQAIRSMNAPPDRQWDQVSDIFRDETWTEEVQGVAWNGSHWIFSANANQIKTLSDDKAIYVFAAGSTLSDDEWATRIKYHQVPHPIAGTSESDCHWGQVTYYDGFVYVAHFWELDNRRDKSSIVVFRSDGAELTFHEWIELSPPPGGGRVEFQTINPWDGLFYTYRGGHFFKYDRQGNYTGEKLIPDPLVHAVQGACFSPNGHLYVASNETLPDNEDYQTIHYYSALNGHRLGIIPVPAFEHYKHDELEGICYADVGFRNGRQAQIHAILLENPFNENALDNIFFKSFAPQDEEHEDIV